MTKNNHFPLKFCHVSFLESRLVEIDLNLRWNLHSNTKKDEIECPPWYEEFYHDMNVITISKNPPQTLLSSCENISLHLLYLQICEIEI